MPNELVENSSNSELVLELIGVLNKETSLFETFLELLELQQKALVENDLKSLNQITERQREKTIESNILARKRENVIGKLALEQKLTGDLTISNLIETVQSNQAGILSQLRDTILGLNEKIGTIRSQNTVLINRSRDNIMKTMELLGRFKLPANNYKQKGTLDQPNTNVVLDRRA
ncbi:MAG: flagellar protein FlgN [Candidatus Zixiibacteriota bacterium]